jgi:hypothetical protein
MPLHTTNFKALPDRFLVFNLSLTQQERRPQKKLKMTSKKRKKEDNLKKNGKNGRQPQKK